jgi:hypothetical protein
MMAWKRGFWSSGNSAPLRRKSRTSLSTTFFCSTLSVAYSALSRSALYFSKSLRFWPSSA